MSIFINEDYYNYKYLVEASDNYFVLTNSASTNGSWESPDEIDVVYQYIKPSTLTVEGSQTFTTTKSFDKVDLSSDFWERADSPAIFSVSILVIFCTLFILNIFTRIVKRGGILG